MWLPARAGSAGKGQKAGLEGFDGPAPRPYNSLKFLRITIFPLNYHPDRENRCLEPAPVIFGEQE